MKKKNLEPVGVETLHWSCPPLDFERVEPTAGTLIGQERALEALRLGMELYGPGYNLFVSGLTGTRRAASVAELLREIQAICRPAPDRFFVPDFEHPYEPRLLCLPRGRGKAFLADMGRLHRILFGMLARTLRSPALERRIQALREEAREEENRLYGDLVANCKEHGLALVTFQDEKGQPTGQDIFPVLDGEPVPPEGLAKGIKEGKLDREAAKRMLAQRDPLVARLREIQGRARDLQLGLFDKVRALMRQTADGILGPVFDRLVERWKESCETYLRALQTWLHEHPDRILAWTEGREEPPDPLPRPLEIAPLFQRTKDGDDCPVLFESNPTFENLFGSILPGPEGEEPRLSQIRSGSLVRADGGYLVLRLVDVLGGQGVWPMLKRVLKTNLCEIRSVESQGQGVASPLQPQPIPVEVKVVLIGEPGTYAAMAAEDPEFRKIFKIHAEFDRSMPNTRTNRRRYAAFAKDLHEKEGLLPPTPEGLGRFVEAGVRRAGNRTRLSTRFGEMADLYREASYLAGRRGAEAVERRDFLEAETQRRRRMNLPEERYLDLLRRGLVRLPLAGKAVGELNGLVILDGGLFEYGRPVRLSARVGVGELGVIDIERESELSGPIHMKGVQILSGYLTGLFARDFPLCLSASLCFEQSYSGIDGDSASAAELVALLSAIAEVPIRQNLAMTGSVDQQGRIQAVGGVNAKVEGFWRACLAKGVRRGTGVILPIANKGDLCLDPEVLKAVERGDFRVWLVEDLKEVLEILTGLPAGAPNRPGSLLGRVRDRLEGFARRMKAFRG